MLCTQSLGHITNDFHLGSLPKPDDTDSCSDEDEEERPVHPHTGAAKYWAEKAKLVDTHKCDMLCNLLANMIFSSWPSHTNHNQRSNKSTQHTGYEGLLPRLLTHTKVSLISRKSWPCGKCTSPTAMSEEPVFHPVRLNWLENQYSGRLYLFENEFCSLF